MCNLYSMTTNVEAIRRLFQVNASNDKTGNLPSMPGIYPDYPAPIVRNGSGGRELARQALALAEPRGMRPLVAHCQFGLGKLYRRRGTREQAQKHFTTATTLYRAMDMPFWLEQAEAEMREPQ
ncbi:MAG: hypothetical protein QOE39_1134 [Bradyrhizobium sp.]|jgi:putative SOS response-associated peptidase YedK|nr:hypothetical protein [Bradyrhizobium sp.]